MFFPALSVLVALGPQVVRGSFKFTLSPVVQCEPVQISFSGSDANNHSVPTTLTILPLQDFALPIRIPIPNGVANSTGIQLSFLPLPADTRFIASLDDINGTLAKVSDVIKVETPSNPATAVATCFGAGIIPVSFYQLNDTMNQCEPFTITYNTTDPPKIRAFFPRGGSTELPLVNTTTGVVNTATYTAKVPRNKQVALLFDDGAGHLQTTKLVTIGGDSSSLKSCFKNFGHSKMDSSKMSSRPVLSQGAIIGIAVGAVIVVSFAILILLYCLRERRRRRRISFDPALLNRRWAPSEKAAESVFYTVNTPISAPPPFSAVSPWPAASGGFVRDPIYTKEKYASSIMSDARTSISSWHHVLPSDRGEAARSRPGSQLSINTIDVENILQMATVHRNLSGVATGVPQPSTAGTGKTFEVTQPPAARVMGPRRRGGSDPPDVPTFMRSDSARAAAVSGIPAGYSNVDASSTAPSAFSGPSAYSGAASYMSFESDNGHSAADPGNVDGIGGYPVPAFRQGGHRDTSESWGNVVVR
ncbi:hypothetical protein B0H15DRAFT_67300 [Mycena belliarum]|uniref:Uncharacterized protein n=1 Tax=Mycena belliarum TaxID=1033014 RepID=A0AAD6UBZ4_9AGAR|nr:hypothetical protein B0H15DRAFT_67300 [Mycena belliae]